MRNSVLIGAAALIISVGAASAAGQAVAIAEAGGCPDCDLRLASLRGITMAKRKKVDTFSLADLGVESAGGDAVIGHEVLAGATPEQADRALQQLEGLGILDAIDAYTVNGARLMQQEDITGSLEAGKKADFIILDQDIIALANSGATDQVSQTSVVETWFDGRVVYSKP